MGIGFGKKMNAIGKTTIQVAYGCDAHVEKGQCKTAKNLRCRWAKKKCQAKVVRSTCSKLGRKKCRRDDKCMLKNKKCVAAQVKCNQLAKTEDLCMNTPGCFSVFEGRKFKFCRGNVKMG